MPPKANKPLPSLPSFKVQNSGLDQDDEEMDAFVYCADYGSENYEQYKKAYKLKTEYKYGNIKDEYDVEFERKNVKDVIHILTAEIKEKGTKSPYLLLPFRPQQFDHKLKKLLNAIFKDKTLVSNELITSTVKKFDEYTLMSALKFFWCRLPGNCVIGWKTYTKFVEADEEAGFPKRAFLDFMPTCLSSGAHASIVYDFFDLIVAISMNSKSNMLNAKKISKVCGLWAFHPIRNKQSGMPSFERGMYEWIPAGDAMFHLLLSFLNAMPPNGQIEKLPKILQLILKSSPYPPPPTTSTAARFLHEVPMVTIKANNPSKNPAELLARVARTLKFDDPTVFYTREDYLLLKRLFKDVDTLIQKLSSEGSRILDNMCIYDEDLISDGVTNNNHLPFKLVPGWSSDMTSIMDANKRTNDFFTAKVSRVSIDDYFIWAWLASLGSEQTSVKKKTFGKTYIMEVELAEGFKKWVIIEEQDIERDGYDIEIEIKQEKLRELEQKIQEAEREAEAIRLAAKTRTASESRGKDYQSTAIGDLADITNKVGQLYVKDALPPVPLPEKSSKRKVKDDILPVIPTGEVASREREHAPPPVSKDYYHSSNEEPLDYQLHVDLDTENSFSDFNTNLRSLDPSTADSSLDTNTRQADLPVSRKPPPRSDQVPSLQQIPTPIQQYQTSPQRPVFGSPSYADEQSRLKMKQQPPQQHSLGMPMGQPSNFKALDERASYQKDDGRTNRIDYRQPNYSPSPPRQQQQTPVPSHQRQPPQQSSSPKINLQGQPQRQHNISPRPALPVVEPLIKTEKTVSSARNSKASNRTSKIFDKIDDLESELMGVLSNESTAKENQYISNSNNVHSHSKASEVQQIPNSVVSPHRQGGYSTPTLTSPPHIPSMAPNTPYGRPESQSSPIQDHPSPYQQQSGQFVPNTHLQQPDFQAPQLQYPPPQYQQQQQQQMAYGQRGRGSAPYPQPPSISPQPQFRGVSPGRSASPVRGHYQSRSGQQPTPYYNGPPTSQQQIPSFQNGYHGGAVQQHRQQQSQQYRQGPPQQYGQLPPPSQGYYQATSPFQRPPTGHSVAPSVYSVPSSQQGGYYAHQQRPNTYSDKVIGHMPPPTKVDKLHGPLGVGNKGKARNALMNGDFGI